MWWAAEVLMISWKKYGNDIKVFSKIAVDVIYNIVLITLLVKNKGRSLPPALSLCKNPKVT